MCHVLTVKETRLNVKINLRTYLRNNIFLENKSQFLTKFHLIS